MTFNEFLYNLGFPIHVWKYETRNDYGYIRKYRTCIHCKREEYLSYFNKNELKCEKKWIQRYRITNDILREANKRASEKIRDCYDSKTK